MLEIGFEVLLLLSVGSGVVASRVLATRSGRPLKALAICEAVLLAGWGLCCLLPQTRYFGGRVTWGYAFGIWAIGGAVLVALGVIACVGGLIRIGIDSKGPEDDEL
jgi:hypothetical protein